MLRPNTIIFLFMVFLFSTGATDAKQEEDAVISRYMDGPAELVTAPNGAITNTEALQKLSEIMYLEPTTQKVAGGVWCIGGYSVAKTSVIKAEDERQELEGGNRHRHAGMTLSQTGEERRP